MRQMKAYMTVEAVLVMPMVLGVIVLTIYLLFFQYDRCLMEQNAGILAMRGCTLQASDRDSLAKKLYCLIGREDDAVYLAWEMEPVQVTLRGNRVSVERCGYLRFPFDGLGFGIGSGKWDNSVRFQNHRIAPMSFIRYCRKLTGGK